jgi:hypothetical protein
MDGRERGRTLGEENKRKRGRNGEDGGRGGVEVMNGGSETTLGKSSYTCRGYRGYMY